MPERSPTYSSIISAADYMELMTKQHLFIAAADKEICRSTVERVLRGARNIVELGCGPGRLLKPLQSSLKVFKDVKLSGVDLDPVFLEYARSIVDATRTQIIEADVRLFQPLEPVDIFLSQGFHHHVQKGDAVNDYLSNVRTQMSEGGVYILGDEFLPDYHDEEERRVKAVIWYAHIISNAIKKGHNYLAQEEAKTLIDDLNEADIPDSIKTQDQIQLVLKRVQKIEAASASKDLKNANKLAERLLETLACMRNYQATGDQTVDLSRGDYKICDEVLKEELEAAGLFVERVKHIGPIKTVGAMSVYTIKKTA